MQVVQRGDFVGLVRQEGDELTFWRLNEECLDRLVSARRRMKLRRAGLTSREWQVVDLLLLGSSHREIGRQLDISVRTVRFHQRNGLGKLGAETRADLPRVLL